MLFNLRVSLPDRPGTLGALATAMGKGGANILALDVVEREDGYAVDDLCVEAPAGMQEALRRAAEEIPSLVVEEVRPADAFRDILGPMQLAALLSEESPGRVIVTLVENLPDALWASWAAAVTYGKSGMEVIAKSTGSPDLQEMRTPWLPLLAARRLPRAPWMPSRWRTGLISKAGFPGIEAAAAPLLGGESAVLVARKRGPRFRSAELLQLGALSRIASAAAARPELAVAVGGGA